MKNIISGRLRSNVVRVCFLNVCLGLLILGTSLPARAQGRVIPFDAPSAGTGAGQGTISYGINLLGTVVGSYIDENGVSHGFLLHPGNNFTTIDAPGAGKIAGTGTTAIGLNVEGAVAGYYIDGNSEYHGFIRKAGGFTTVDISGACKLSVTEGCVGTIALSINFLGKVLGSYSDDSLVAHGFIRSPDGSVSDFEVSGALATEPAPSSGLNQFGEVVGYYEDSNFVNHGFLRRADGTLVSFDAPGASDTPFITVGTIVTSVNDFAVITGEYMDANQVFHGFVRSAGGTFVAFEAPGADMTKNSGNGTLPEHINAVGTTTGYYRDAAQVYHAFVRQANGTIATIDASGADSTTAFRGTLASATNVEGITAGYYIAGNGAYHGFIREP
jgi:hypothetical protein